MSTNGHFGEKVFAYFETEPEPLNLHFSLTKKIPQMVILLTSKLPQQL